MQPSQGGGVESSAFSGASAIRVGTDITKRKEDVDPVRMQKKLAYQEEIKKQMEEEKARKEAEKLRLKQ